ncbi:unnamed protein product [Gemmata massiliana]|uniref:Uncharacterized protein n=1 Tax=Gemmata massiliana TaxID=1210884 RepID=A0A6P2DAN0_9BACT|nr:hypothetical protein [Gemmata massiliana]VTR97937.1 unnamed protein product [Gemmata massiliana]VTR98849.1 unnamed protein product [Gemmata massiliana]
MNRSRLLKLERRVSRVKCPQCGKAPADRTRAPLGLTPEERAEIARLSAGAWSRCPGCAGLKIDLSGVNAEDRKRAAGIVARALRRALHPNDSV